MAPVEEKPTSPSDGPQPGSGQTGPSSGSTNKAPNDDNNSVGSTPPPSVPAVPAKPSDPSVQSPPTPPSHSIPAIPPSQTPSNNSPPKNSPITPSTRPSDPSDLPNKPPPAPSTAPGAKSSPTSTQSTPSNTNNDSGPGNAGDNGSKEGTPVQPTPPPSSSMNHQSGNDNGPDGNGGANPSQGQSGPPPKPSISPPFGDPKGTGTGVRPPFPTKTLGAAGNNNPTSSIIVSQSGAVLSKSNSNGEGVPTKTGDSHSPTFTPFDGSDPGEEPSGPTFGSSSSSGNTGFSSVPADGPSPSQNFPGHQGGSSSKGPPSVSGTSKSNGSSNFSLFNVPDPTSSFPGPLGPPSTISNQSPDHTGTPGIPSSIFNDPDRTLSSSFTPPPISSSSQDKGHTATILPVHGTDDPLTSLFPTLPPIPSQSPPHKSSTPSPLPTPSVTQTNDGPIPVQTSIPFSDPTIANGPDHDPSSTQESKPSSTPSDPSKGGDDDPFPKPPVSPSSSQNQSGNDPKPTPTGGNDPESADNGPKPTNIVPSQPPSPPKSPVETIFSTKVPGDNGQTLIQTQAQSATRTPSSSSLTFSAPPPLSPSLSSTAPLLPPVRAASSAPSGSSNSIHPSFPLGVLQSHGTSTGLTETPSLIAIVSTRSATTSVVSTIVPTTVSSGSTSFVTSFPTTTTIVLPLSVVTSFSTLASTPTPDGVAAASSGGSHTGPIVGAFVGAVIAALILAAISFYIIRRKRRIGPIILQDDMAFTGEGAGVSVPPPPPPLAGGLFGASETPYSPVSTTENNRRSETNEHNTGGRDYQRVLVQSPSMESLRESLMGITRLSPVPQLLLGDPFGDHSRMDDSDDDRSTFRGGSSVGHGSAHSIRSSPSIRSNRSTTSTVRFKRTFRTITVSPTPLEDNNPFADNNNVLIDHPGPSSAEFFNDPFADDLLGQDSTSGSDHLSAETLDTSKRYISRLSAGSAITNLSYEPSEDGTIGYAL